MEGTNTTTSVSLRFNLDMYSSSGLNPSAEALRAIETRFLALRGGMVRNTKSVTPKSFALSTQFCSYLSKWVWIVAVLSMVLK